MRQIVHVTEGLARPCSAWDLFTVSGGMQCGNCLAHNVEPMPNRCHCTTADDKPCPLQAEPETETCWIHALQGR